MNRNDTDHHQKLRQIENMLAMDQIYGNPNQILNRVLTFFHRGVERLSDRVESSRECLLAFERATDERRFRVFCDPVVRDVIAESLAWLKEGSERSFSAQCDEIMKAIPRYLEKYCTTTPLENAVKRHIRLGDAPHYAWVWSEDREEDIFSERFRALFQREIANSVSSKPVVLRSPDDRMEKSLVLGYRLLLKLLPTLGLSVLRHVQLVAVIDVADKRKWNRPTRADLCQNVSTHAIPGTIFLSPSPLRSPWHAAEALLHEAAHKKLSDLVLTRSIFRKGFRADTAQTIRSVWNSPLSWNPNDWSSDRALFAFHVYTHLGLFFQVVEEKKEELAEEFGDLCGMDPAAAARGALDRARYLGSRLVEVAQEDLGEDGKSLVFWLNQLLQAIDPNPPRPDPTIHLWLDRYDRETNELGKLIRVISTQNAEVGNDAPDAPYDEWSALRLARHLVQSDLVAAYRILSVLGEAQPPVLPYYDGDRWSVTAMLHTSPQELADLFQSLRRVLSRTLRTIPDEAFQRICQTRRTKTLRDLVEEMIEHPYRHVPDLLNSMKRQNISAAP